MPSKTKETGYQFADLGAFSQLGQYQLEIPVLKRPVSGKVFLKEMLGLSSMEVSLNRLPVGGAMPFWHRHRENEELYIFLNGEGEFLAGDERFRVKEGSCIAVQPEVRRAWRNTSQTEPLTYIVIQAKQHSLTAGDIQDGERVEEPLHW
jgi:mannose-6-phosphate isomerase-like protein (cupin superfamily)